MSDAQQYSGIWTVTQVAQAIRDQNWVNIPPPNVEYLVVAGGGGGGPLGGGGGGAGGLLTGFSGVTVGTQLWVTIGAGGTGSSSYQTPGGNGNASVFGAASSGASTGNIVATGGGGGGANTNTSGLSGGSGGGGNYNSGPGGAGISGQGNAGGAGASSGSFYCGPGGGGAGTVGISELTTAAPGVGKGGAGIASAISGTVTTYAGGGGGGGNNGQVGCAGGAGGGGTGGQDSNSVNATAGTANTGGGGGGGGGGFPSFGYGANGGSGVVIISYPDTFAAPVSTTGSPTVSTSGSGSLAFNGSTDYMSVTTPALGSGDFTIEFWVYLNSVSTTFYYDGRGAGSSGLQPTVYYNSGLKYFTNGGDRINGAALSTSQWYHIAVSRVSGNTRMFINGTQTGSTYADSNTYVASTTGSGWISGNGSFFTNGYITNLRIIVGTGLYSGAFTVPTAPLTAVSGTQLLLSSVSGSPFLDSSSSARTVTNFGTPTWNQLSPFTGTGFKNRVYTWTSSGSITF